MKSKTLVRNLLPHGLVTAYWRVKGVEDTERPRRTILSQRWGSHDILGVTDFFSAVSSARYYEQKMLHCKIASDDLALLTQAIGWRKTEGLVMEFGVASGRTINHLATALPNESLYGFDSFEGLPENWRTGYEAGAFAQPMPTVGNNVTLVKGWFDQTLPAFLATHPESVSLLHVDCDLYSSTATILKLLSERIIPGTVIVFDEYLNYPGWKRHEFLAFKEFVSSNSRHYEYLGLVPDHQQVCVRITQ